MFVIFETSNGGNSREIILDVCYIKKKKNGCNKCSLRQQK